MTISNILKVALFSVVAAACTTTEENQVDKLSDQLCTCQEIFEGKLTPELRTKCEDQVAVLLTKAPASCMPCLEKKLGDSATRTTCTAAESSCDCKIDGDEGGDDD